MNPTDPAQMFIVPTTAWYLMDMLAVLLCHLFRGHKPPKLHASVHFPPVLRQRNAYGLYEDNMISPWSAEYQ